MGSKIPEIVDHEALNAARAKILAQRIKVATINAADPVRSTELRILDVMFANIATLEMVRALDLDIVPKKEASNAIRIDLSKTP